MAVISEYAKRKKLNYFFSKIPKNAHILDVGCGNGWVSEYAKANGWGNITGIDISPTANCDIAGDINDWKRLGLKENSYDAIIAFEVIEHGDFYKAFSALLKPGGKLYVTTPIPHMDWACKILEYLKLNQKRTSSHTHLIYLKKVPLLQLIEKNVMEFMSQWGIFQKPLESESKEEDFA